MNKANSLHNPYKLGELIAQRSWYKLDSQVHTHMKQLSINAFTLYCTDTTEELQTDP
jgi:hypothetical protein